MQNFNKLFGKKYEVSEVVAVKEEPKPVVRPVPITEWVVLEEDSFENYSSLAKEIGFKPSVLVREQLSLFLYENGIARFNYKEVKAWLKSKRIEAGKDFWCWCPLREEDVVDHQWGKWKKDGSYRKEYCAPYDKIIPLQAMNLIKKIQDVFQEDVCFFVSDYPSVVPDPFLMVRTRGNEDIKGNDHLFVIAMWDEPGFTG